MQTYFTDLVSRGPVLINEGEVFFLSENFNSSDRLTFAGAEPGFGVVPGGNLRDILRLYSEIKSREIYELKKNFIQNNIDFPLLSEGERKKAIERRKVIQFIMEELIPLYESQEIISIDNIEGRVINEEKREPFPVRKDELQRKIQRIKKELHAKLISEENAKTFSSHKEIKYLRRLLPSFCLIFEGIVYSLKKPQQSLTQIIITSNKNTNNFSLEEFCSVSEVEKKYEGFFKWKRKSESIEELSEYLEGLCSKLLNVKYNLDELIKYKEFEEGRIGFLNKDKGVFVYKRIPPFAMLDPRPEKEDVCYEFPSCRVSCCLSYNNDNKLLVQGPYLVEKFVHVFSGSSPGDFQQICGMRLPEPEKDHPNAEYVARALDMAENLVTNGLTPDSLRNHAKRSSNNHPRYNAGYLGDIVKNRKITVYEAKEKGLLLTNNWKW